MLLLSLVATLPVLGVLGGQMPVVDGVIGGVPSSPNRVFESQVLSAVATNTTTPGKLRIVENSGVCGEHQ